MLMLSRHALLRRVADGEEGVTGGIDVGVGVQGILPVAWAVRWVVGVFHSGEYVEVDG